MFKQAKPLCDGAVNVVIFFQLKFEAVQAAVGAKGQFDVIFIHSTNYLQ